MSEAQDIDSPAVQPRARKRKFFLRLLAIVVVLGTLAWAAWYLFEGCWYESTEDAYVTGNVVQISPHVPGTVVAIAVDEGDFVHAGDVLVTLDPTDTTVALAAARAALASTVRQTRGLYSQLEAAEAEVKARQVALDKARSDFRRRKNLAETGAIPTEVLAHARDALVAAKSALASAREHANAAEALVGGTDVASNPAVKTAAARLRKAWLDHARTTLVAPVDGHVAKRSVQLGEKVSPGRPLLAVVPLDSVWVEANFKETQLKHMRIGQPVALESDVYGGDVTYHGTVAALGVGTGSVFSLLPAQNATGNWIKIVQRVPVRITLAGDQLANFPLRLGLSMTATVNLHDRSGPRLVARTNTEPAQATDVYDRQLDEADAMIARVIRQNLAPQQPAEPEAAGE